MIRSTPVLLALVAAVGLAACQPVPGGGPGDGPTITPREGATSEIRGRVVSYPEGDPIADISVVPFDVQARYEVFVTDPDGYYTATGLTPGFYRVKAWPLDGQDFIGAYYSDTYFYCTGRLLDLRGGAVAEGVDFQLPHGGAIEGTVTDAVSGEPIEQARVDVKGLDYYNNNLDPTTYTDAEGAFRIVGLDSAIDDPETLNPVPGHYELKISAPGRPVIYHPGVYSPTDAVPVGAIRGQTTLIDVEVPTGAVISGSVADHQGAPVSGGVVEAVHRLEPWIQSSVSIQADGTFALGGLAPGEYALELTAAGHGSLAPADPVALEEDEVVSGLAFELPAEATVSGTLEAGGQPLEGGMVQAVPLSGVSATSWSLEDGRFTLSQLGPAEYYFYVLPGDDASLAGYVCGDALCASIAEATLLAVEAGEDLDLGPVACPPAATLTGQVRQREGQVPLGRIYVTALPEEAGQPSMLAVSADEDGAFAMTGMRPGRYTLSAEPYRYCGGDPGWVTTYSGDGRRPEEAELLELEAGGGAEHDLTLPEDLDGDGMSDVWEWLHFLEPSRDDSLEDPDLDGVTNLDEYLERTDPHDDLGASCAVGRRSGAGVLALLALALAWSTARRR